MTINRYERGALPSKSHSDILKLIQTSEDFFYKKVEEAFLCGRITERTYDKIKQTGKTMLLRYEKKLLLQNSIPLKVFITALKNLTWKSWKT